MSTVLPLKKSKVVCTIGPASQSLEVLEQMMHQGMNIARINFAHGNFADHRQVINHVRLAAKNTGQRVAIFGDLPGPKMRIGRLLEEPIELETGQPFSLQTGEIIGNRHQVSMSFEKLPQVVTPGDDIFLNDGFIQLRVEQVETNQVHCRVLVGGQLRSHKGLNLPGINLGISAFTPRDHECLRFAAEQGLDGVSQSFVEQAQDIVAVRTAAHAMNYNPFIVAKIERSGALANLSDILEAADGIMVARGDLGVEIPVEEIALNQKRIIHEANLRGKPVITATHMLESMTTNRRPTRAEVTDVANAILDGTDCIMLSGETAIGHYPAEAVAMMARIAQVTETSVVEGKIDHLLQSLTVSANIAIDDLVSYNIFLTTQTLKPVIVFVPSASGDTARRITRFRLKPWIVAISPHESTCQKLQFSYGVFPEHLVSIPLSWPHYAQDWLKQHPISGNLALVIEGGGTLTAGDTTRIDIIVL